MQKISYGPPGNASRGSLLKRAASFLKNRKEDEFCYLAPTGQLLNGFREQLLEESGVRAAGHLHFYLFEGFFNEILKGAGLYKPSVSELEQEIILRRVLKELHG